MVKRIVLEHASGLRQICGILDVPEKAELERSMLHNRLAYTLITAGKRHVVYREVEPEVNS